MQFYSQAGQDFFIFHNFFRNKRDGVFVEIGAYDGVTFSNCMMLEETLGWRGLCIEPLPRQFEKLKAKRRATCLNIALSDFEGEADFLDVDNPNVEKMLSGLVKEYDPRQKELLDQQRQKQSIIRVKVRPVQQVFADHGIGSIDYCSLDVEGAEMTILRAWDFEKNPVDVFSIENNHQDSEVRDFMAARGYDFVINFHGYDDLYVRKGVVRQPTSTVVLAVPPDTLNRDEAVRAWHDSLDRQAKSFDFERITVFSGAAGIIEGLPGAVQYSSIPLSFGQSMNLALSQITTPHVFSLGLLDRFFDGALQEMQDALDQGNDWIGGDWILCLDDESTKKIEKVMPSEAFFATRDWSPPIGVRQRVGNSTGNCDWAGPGFGYRSHVHGAVGRFPWRFGDSSIMQGHEEQYWIMMLSKVENIRLVMLPKVIGNVRVDPKIPRGRAMIDADAQEKLSIHGILP